MKNFTVHFLTNICRVKNFVSYLLREILSNLKVLDEPPKLNLIQTLKYFHRPKLRVVIFLFAPNVFGYHCFELPPKNDDPNVFTCPRWVQIKFFSGAPAAVFFFGAGLARGQRIKDLDLRTHVFYSAIAFGTNVKKKNKNCCKSLVREPISWCAPPRRDIKKHPEKFVRAILETLLKNSNYTAEIYLCYFWEIGTMLLGE